MNGHFDSLFQFAGCVDHGIEELSCSFYSTRKVLQCYGILYMVFNGYQLEDLNLVSTSVIAF